MTPIEQWADKIFVINRDARTDRKEQYEREFERCGIERYERFQAYDHANIDGWVGGNGGCTASHRALLEIIAYHKWKWTIIFEDDVKARFDDTQEKFKHLIAHVPADADMIYLGGHYGSKPQARINEHCIKINTMLTTSSYAITWQFARFMAPNIYGSGPIDSLYGGFQMKHNCYCIQPRLFVQRESFSDLQGRVMANEDCMTNSAHESMV